MLRKQYDKMFLEVRERGKSYADDVVSRGHTVRVVANTGKRKGETGLVDRMGSSKIWVRFDDGERESFTYQTLDVLGENGEIIDETVKDALHRPVDVGDWVAVAVKTMIEVGQIKKITPAGLVTVEVKMIGGRAVKHKKSHSVEMCRVIKLPVSDKDLMKSMLTGFEQK